MKYHISLEAFGNGKGVKMGSVKKGDVVSIDYAGKLEDGQVIATTIKTVAEEAGIYSPDTQYRPYTFTVGSGETIKGIDEEIIGMEKGEQKEIIIPPDKGFGYPDQALIREFPMETFKESNIEPEKGMMVRTPQGVGEIINVLPNSVILNFNHPLAGKTLIFNITIVDIREA